MGSGGSAFSDWLQGDDEANILTGVTGNDTLDGGAGDDTYVFNAGDGVDTLIGTGENDVIQLGAGIGLVGQYFSRGGDDLYIQFRNAPADRIIVTGRFSGTGDGASFAETLRFADGTVVDLSAPTLALEIQGSGSIHGYGGGDRITGGAAIDYIHGHGGYDTLVGGGGADGIWGGDGGDLINGGDGDDQIWGEAGGDVLSGGAGDDLIWGGDGNDALSGGSGADYLVGGSGDDRYLFRRGAGADVIVEDDSASTDDRLVLGSGIGSDQIWFEQTGADLRLTIIGTSDQISIQNWYSSAANRIDAFEAADGKVLMAAQVEQLRSVMATFTAPAAGQIELSPDLHAALDPVIAAAWH